MKSFVRNRVFGVAAGLLLLLARPAVAYATDLSTPLQPAARVQAQEVVLQEASHTESVAPAGVRLDAKAHKAYQPAAPVALLNTPVRRIVRVENRELADAKLPLGIGSVLLGTLLLYRRQSRRD